jgi:glucose/arabinose dehydrogenase
MKLLILCLTALLFFNGIYIPGNKAPGKANAPADPNLIFTLKEVATGLDGPVALENAHDGSERIFVGEQAGKIRVIKNGKLLKEPFLDIRSLLVTMKNEYMDVGLLGFAFHPDFKNNGRFFVHYSSPTSKKGFNNKSVLAEFHVSASNTDKADTSRKVILEVEQPEENHNGGNIVFDKQGYLYMGFGDGGGQGDKHGTDGNGQNLHQLSGKIIRIDINHEKPYVIPADNPFVGTSARGEIWCYGMRMPWRISFDQVTGALFCGDVGQDKYEEVDIIEKGKNYGWRAMEGFHIYDSVLYKKGGKFALPVIEYQHPEGISITGGYVYRGKKFPAMEGKYIFGDWAFKVFYMEKNQKGKWVKKNARFEGKDNNTFNFRINSFGVDESGEIYLVTQTQVGAIDPSGVVYKLEAKE